MIFYCDFIFHSNRFEERGQEKRRGCVRLQHIVLISVLSILLYLTSCTKYSQSVSVYKSLAYSTYVVRLDSNLGKILHIEKVRL